MKMKTEYYAVSNSEGRHSFVVAHDGDLEKTLFHIVQGLMDDMCAEKVEIEEIQEMNYETKEYKFKYFENIDDSDEDANEDTFEIAYTALYGDTTKQDIEIILFQYAEDHALTSTKSEITEFNEWVEENLNHLN